MCVRHYGMLRARREPRVSLDMDVKIVTEDTQPSERWYAVPRKSATISENRSMIKAARSTIGDDVVVGDAAIASSPVVAHFRRGFTVLPVRRCYSTRRDVVRLSPCSFIL